MKGDRIFEEPLPRGNAADLTDEGPRRASLESAWRNALTKRNVLDLRKAMAEELRGQVEGLCSDIVAHGSNAERIYQLRMLNASLLQARRQLESAYSQHDEALGELRRAQAARLRGADDPAFAASRNE